MISKFAHVFSLGARSLSDVGFHKMPSYRSDISAPIMTAPITRQHDSPLHKTHPSTWHYMLWYPLGLLQGLYLWWATGIHVCWPLLLSAAKHPGWLPLHWPSHPDNVIHAAVNVGQSRWNFLFDVSFPNLFDRIALLRPDRVASCGSSCTGCFSWCTGQCQTHFNCTFIPWSPIVIHHTIVADIPNHTKKVK
jgi:hypothetical protein